MQAAEGPAWTPDGGIAYVDVLRAAFAGPFPALAAMLLTQCHASTAPWSLLAMAALALPAWWRDEGGRLGTVEWSVLGIALAFALSALASGTLTQVAPLAAPLAGFVAFVLIAGRARGDEAVRVVALLGLVSLLQVVPVLVALASAARPAMAMREAAVPWLVVPNDLAWMACAWPWWLAIARERPGATRFAVAALLLLQFVAFVLLGSRLAIAVAATGSGYALLRDARGRWFAAGALAAGSIAVLALGKGVASMDARLELWRAALALFRTHPLFGVGPHGFVQHYTAWLPAAPVDPRVTPWPHSLPLEVLAQWGVVGAVAVAFAVFATWRAARARHGARFALAPVAVAFALVACIEASALRLWVWGFAALLLAWPRLDDAIQGRMSKR